MRLREEAVRGLSRGLSAHRKGEGENEKGEKWECQSSIEEERDKTRQQI